MSGRATPPPSAPCVGIDDLNVYGSTLAVDLAAVAAARGRSWKDLRATGFTRRSITPPYEDPVTLAVNAARPVVEAAGRDGFGLVLVATETGLDYGKPISTYIHRHLGLRTDCRNVEIKHACYGGTAAVQLAASWVRSGAEPGRKALVVMTDMARRHFDDPAELTAGTGAVALSIAAEPALLRLEPGSGCASREVYDVARPTATTEFGDAVLSIAAYLDLAEEAWTAYCAATACATTVERRFDFMLYHTPLVSLVKQAHALLLDDGAADADASFETMVAPALGHARELANIYSGSVYCLLAGLLDGDAPLRDGTRVGFFSYGSGACAEIFGATVMRGARAAITRRGIGRHLAERAIVDVAEYERLVCEADVALTARDYEPARDFVHGHYERAYRGRNRLVLRRVDHHHRQYEWSDG